MAEKQKDVLTNVCHPTIYNSVKIFAILTGNSYDPETQKVSESRSSTRDRIITLVYAARSSISSRFPQYCMLPTEYMRQMLMSFQERIGYILRPDRTIDVSCLSDQCKSECFDVSPPILFFQQFVPGNVYNVTLTIRNATMVVPSFHRISY